MAQFSEGILSRVLVVAFGFFLILLDRQWFSPWPKFVGGFLVLYAFIPMRVNPLVGFVDDLLKKARIIGT